MNINLVKFSEDCNKYTRGKTAIIGGSIGMTGSVCLSAQAASRSGCGLVVVCVPDSLNNILEVKLTEEMTFPVSEQDGALSTENFNELMETLKKCNSVAIGMGAGTKKGFKALLKRILCEYEGKILIDADGLNVLSSNQKLLKDAKGQIILTPHTGEFSRLTGIKYAEIEKNREEFAKEYALKNKIVLILKGKESIVTDGNRVYRNNTGNNGMAKGGSGDVLSGIIASLLAQGMETYEAAKTGCYIHGLAGDIACRKLTDMSMTARDIIDNLSEAFKKIL